MRLRTALEEGPWLVGEEFTAADLIFASAGQWAREILPQGSVVDEWLARSQERPAYRRAAEREQELMDGE